ncbi:MAG: HAD family acid phosphatase [Candidatus Endonucleobacter sp. (ex Gigantidas childressi)]|nr:HAD family acid phosphatase [Candidatus Endonucleobacter sp. (ex Gigantidas childressi)]
MLKHFFQLLIIATINTSTFGSQAPTYSQQDLNDETVIAAYWMQNSPEYRALTYQGFNIAADQLKEKLALTPKNSYPAIIIDIDDTILGGTPLFSSLADTGDVLTTKRYIAWWQDKDKQLEALPGAVAFIKKVANLGVEVFYSSERHHNVMKQTIKTLHRHGFPFANKDHILLQPSEGTPTSKEEQYNRVKSKGFNTLMVIGDQLEDMATLPPHFYTKPQAWSDIHSEKFGNQWVMMPNPLYGPWESSLINNYNSLTNHGKHKVRLEKLNTSLDTTNDPQFRQHMMQAAIWQNFSGSCRALNYQAYNQAIWQLKQIAKDAKTNLPAIVVNVDGTVLNIADDLSLLNIKNNINNRDKKLLHTENTLINGVKPFLQQAQTLGFEIFYISNRPISSSRKNQSDDIERATINNLKKHGLPNADTDHILFAAHYCPNKGPSCDKAFSRKAIESGYIKGKKHQIVLLIGDKLDDFDLTEKKLDPRLVTTADKVKSQFGRKYILVPNLLSMPDIRRVLREAANNKKLELMTEEELAKLRINQLKGWPGKPITSK